MNSIKMYTIKIFLILEQLKIHKGHLKIGHTELLKFYLHM